MDLATFNNFVNNKGGNVASTGTQTYKNINQSKGGNFVLNDHKKGQAA